MVEDDEGRPIVQKIGPGTSVYVPASRYHSTANTGDGSMTVFVVYAPTGPEQVLRSLPGCEISAAAPLTAFDSLCFQWGIL